MRHLTVKNLGPIQEANLELEQINIIIGLQSSGKSCILKTACYCSWIEKRLELAQGANGFDKGSTFLDLMTDYYSMAGYVHEDTYIEYETAHLKFSYDHSARSFKMQWKSGRWKYRRPKVSYVPADRNLVAAIPGWSSLSLDKNMIEFMSNWDKARRFIKTEENFLNLGMSYRYDSMSNSDKIHLGNGRPLMLKEGSSGIQSLLPMYVHLDYLTNGQYKDDNSQISYEQREERKQLIAAIHDKLRKKGTPTNDSPIASTEAPAHNFPESDQTRQFQEIYQRYTKVDHSEIFLEEPEDNLFPPTQCQLVDWLLESIRKHNDILFIATHSPYILNQFIKANPSGLTVFFTHRIEDKQHIYSIRQLKESEIHEIYDNGVDMFFNFELYL